MSHRLGFVLLLLASCGPSGKSGPTGNVDTSGRACPPAAAVRLAVWRSPDGYGGDSYGTPQAGHWQVPLKLFRQRYDDNGEATSTAQATGPRTEAEVRAMVDGPLGAEAWLYINGAAQPCAGKVVGYYLTAIEGDAMPYELLAAQVDGCAEPGDWQHSTFAVLGVDPTGCALALPETVSSRDGSYPEVADDEQSHFQMPGGADQLPPELAGVITPPACEAPPCRPLWRVYRAGVAGAYVYDADLMWLSPGEPGDECSWIIAESRRLYLGGDVAVSPAPVTVEGMNWETGQPAPEEVTVELAGVLHDGGGARLMLTTAPGMFGVHELDGTRLGAGAMHDWYVAHEEEYIDATVGPACGL